MLAHGESPLTGAVQASYFFGAKLPKNILSLFDSPSEANASSGSQLFRCTSFAQNLLASPVSENEV